MTLISVNRSYGCRDGPIEWRYTAGDGAPFVIWIQKALIRPLSHSSGSLYLGGIYALTR